MATSAKATVPTIGEQASAMQLSQCAKNLASALAELRTAAQKVTRSDPVNSSHGDGSTANGTCHETASGSVLHNC